MIGAFGELYFSPMGNGREGRKMCLGEQKGSPYFVPSDASSPVAAILRRAFFSLRTAQRSSRASIVISALKSLETGQPDLALCAISWNLVSSAPGTLAETFK
jgi:hypothetical protein